MNAEACIWDGFTNKFKLSKTLRFELKPVGKTNELIRQIKDEKDFKLPLADLILEDKTRSDEYKKVKKLIDNLHRDFLKFSLSDEHISENQKEKLKKGIESFYQKYKANKKDKGIISIQKSLATTLVKIFDSNAPKFLETLNEQKERLEKLKKNDEKELKEKKEKRQKIATEIQETDKIEIEKLKSLRKERNTLDKEIKDLEREFAEYKKCLDYTFEKVSKLYEKTDTLFTLLRLYYIKDEKATTSIKKFDGFNSYFGGFNENRKNVYDSKGVGLRDDWHFKQTSISHRLFEQNIKFHFDNLKKWADLQKKLENYPEELEEQDWDWKLKLKKVETDLSFNDQDLFKPESFVLFLSPGGIDKYNEIIGGISAETGENKVIGLNELINSTRGKAGAVRKDFPSLQEFHKQILSEREDYEIFENNSNLIEAINDFVGKEKKLIDFIERGDKEQGKVSFHQLLTESRDRKAEIYISKESLRRFFSNDLTGKWDALENWFLSGFEDKLKKEQAKRKAFTIKELEDELEEKREWDDTAYINSKEKNNFYEQYIEKADKTNRPWLKSGNVKPENIFFSYFKAKFEYLKKQREEALRKYHEVSGDLKKREGSLTDKEKKPVKEYLDASQDLFRFFRNLNLTEKDLGNKDQNDLWKQTIQENFVNKNRISNLYNKARNFLTKKAFSTKKFKLNFEKTTLLKGFVESGGNTQYGAYLFRGMNKIGGYNFFIGLSKKGTWFQTSKTNNIKEDDKSRYERLQYYQPKSTTFYSKNYSNKKKPEILKSLQELSNIALERVHDEDGVLRNKVNGLFEENPTPTNVMAGLSKITELKISPNEELSELIKETIADLQEHCKKYTEKNPSLNEIIDKKYSFKNFENNGLKQLLKDLEKVCEEKEFSYSPISQSEFDDASNTDKDPLHFFQITNKDLNYPENKEKRNNYRGKDNLHTLFFKSLMNGNQKIIDIGTGEVFYRKSSVKHPIIHKKGEILKHKHFEKIWEDISMPIGTTNTKEEILAKKGITLKGNDISYLDKIIGRVIDKKEREIIKDRRYTQDKILLHLSVILNYGDKTHNFNQEINEHIKEHNQEVNIIGIDRGERNLLYYSIINQQGDILENGRAQGSFNEIDSGFKPKGENRSIPINYWKKLDKKEKERKGAREKWETIKNIKELKAGYLSLVVHELSKLIIKYNSIVVLEALNVGFIRERFKVDKQIYQKFERALIDKLNYLVFKDCESRRAGHHLKGYQLTNKLDRFQKPVKQSGILFYTAASYTSKTDPITGYMKNLYPNPKNAEQIQKFFGKFDSIIYNGEHFEFTYDLKNLKGITGSFEDKKENDEMKLSKTKWTIHSHIERSQFREKKLRDNDKDLKEYEGAKNGKWKSHQPIDVNQKLKELFKRENIDLETGKDYKEVICDSDKIDQFQSSKFLAELTNHFRRLLDMRVTDSSKMHEGSHNDESDFILSPVKPFYDSRKCKHNPELPRNSDANGAYNIARKGIIILNKIKNAEFDNEGKLKINLSLSKTDWQNYAQKDGVVKRQRAKYSK